MGRYEYDMIHKVPDNIYYKIKGMKGGDIMEVSRKYDISPNVIRRINPLFKRDIEMKQKD